MKQINIKSKIRAQEPLSRRKQEIQVEIDTLALHGFPRSHGTRMAEALQVELTRLLRQEPNALRRSPRMAAPNASMPEINVRSGARPEEIARQAAASIHASITG